MKLLSLVPALLLLGAPFPAHATQPPLLPPAGPAGPELTEPFLAFARSRPGLTKESLQGCRVLLVPGFNADYIEATRGYFFEQRAVLAGLGLREGEDYLVLRHEFGFSGEKGVGNNARAIAAALKASPRPVLLVSHSKGAIDTLEALRSDPAARAKVRGWITVQGAFFGSALADELAAGVVTRPLLRLALAAFGGGMESMDDLRQATRLQYMQEHGAEIEALIREIPVLGVSTRKSQSALPFGLRLLGRLWSRESAAGETDGLLEIRHTLIPSVPFVVLEGVDHQELTQNVGPGIDRSAFTRAILGFFLERLRSR